MASKRRGRRDHGGSGTLVGIMVIPVSGPFMYTVKWFVTGAFCRCVVGGGVTSEGGVELRVDGVVAL